MKTSALLCAALLCLSAPAFAADDHAHGAIKAQHGGVAVESGHLEFELVARPDTVTIHVRDHGKPVATDGATARVTWLADGRKTETDLAPAGENRLAAQGAFPVAKGSKVVALVKLPKRRNISVRFVLP